MGHATRVSVLVDLLSRDNEILVIAQGRGYYFLKQRFPHLRIIKPSRLELRYSRSKLFFNFLLVFIAGKLIINCLLDRLLLQRLIKEFNPGLIISDNRFCFWSRRVRSVYLTHQLQVEVPRALRFFSGLVQKLNRYFIRKYDMVLVPDVKKGDASLAGSLSHPLQVPDNVRYIGLLSRFYGISCIASHEYQVVAVVSGPEPARTRLVNILRRQLSEIKFKSLIVSGKPEADIAEACDNVTVVSHLEDKDFCRYISGARFIIVRAGYSSLMDMVALGRSAIIIPTPGQTEQEYLARYLHGKNYFYAIDEDKVNLKEQLLQFEKVKDELEKNIRQLRGEAFFVHKELKQILM